MPGNSLGYVPTLDFPAYSICGYGICRGIPKSVALRVFPHIILTIIENCAFYLKISQVIIIIGLGRKINVVGKMLIKITIHGVGV